MERRCKVGSGRVDWKDTYIPFHFIQLTYLSNDGMAIEEILIETINTEEMLFFRKIIPENPLHQSSQQHIGAPTKKILTETTRRLWSKKVSSQPRTNNQKSLHFPNKLRS